MPVSLDDYLNSPQKDKKKSPVTLDEFLAADTQQSEQTKAINHSAVQGLTKTFDTLRSGKLPELQPTPVQPKTTWEKIKSLPSDINTGVESFFDAAANTATFGLHNKLLQSHDEAQRIQNEDSIVGKSGGFAGAMVPIGGAYATGGKLAAGALGRLAPNAGRITQSLVRGAGAGLTYGTGREAIQAAQGEQQSLGGRAKDVAIDAALFGGGDAALSGVGQLFRQSKLGQAFTDFLQRDKQPVSQPEPLGLPNPVLYLPAPRVLPATTARIQTQTNPYRQKLESLFAEGKRLQDNGQMMPGREREMLDDVWSRMAGPNDPGLDELIQMAYSSRPNRLSTDLAQQAKQYQQSREAAGVSLPVRTAQDRYPTGVTSPAAAPRMRLERTTTPSVSVDVQAAEKMKGNWFTNLFGNQGVGISAFNSTKRLNKGPLTTEGQIVKSGLKTDAQGIKDTIAAQARASYQNMVDYLSPLKRIGQQVYESAMDASRSNNIANTIIRDKFVTPEGQVMGEGLQNIFKKVARGQDKQFVDYLTLRHAATRMGRGEQVYADTVTWNGQKMTPEVVQQRLDMYNQRHPGFQDIAKEWDGFHDNVLKTFGVDEGMISPELYTALREKNPNYSPMQRQFSRSEKPGRNFLAKTTNASFSGQKAPIKEVSPTGSARNIVDPRKTTIESVGAWANAAMRNRVMQSMVDAIKVNPEAFKGVAEIVQKPKGATDLRQVLLDGGQNDFVESLNGDFKNLFKTTKVDGENIVRAMVKGEPVYMQVHDPELVKTLINMGPQASNVLVDVLTSFSNATKRGATGLLAPVFAVKGATMDLVQSAIQAKNPVQQAAYTVHAIFSGIGDKLNIPGLKNIAEEYRRSGGGYSAALKGERKLNTQISNMTREPLLSPRSIGKGAVNLVKAPFKALESVGDIAENAPRIAAYKVELKRLGNERTPDNIRKAMDASREITVNFSRKGALSRDLEAAIPYNNAAIQGTYRIMKGIKENPVKTAASIAVLAVVPKLYEYAQFHADPDYQNLPARERMRFLFVHKNNDGTFTKIPMEPAYNSIGEMTIEAMRHYQDSDPQAFKGSMDALANAWLPPMVTGGLQGVTQGGGIETSIKGAINSTVAAPFVATVSNQSFTGAPIVSRSISDRSPQYQYDERTSSIAKKLGAATGMSPQKADYLIRAYGGDPARLLLPLTSEVGAGNTRNTLLKNFIVDPAYTNTLTNDYYAGKQKLDSAYRDNKEVGAPFPSWYDEGLRKQLDSQAAGSISKRLSILSDKKKTLSADKSLSVEQKAAQLKDIQAQTNSIYLDVNSRLQKSGVLGK